MRQSVNGCSNNPNNYVYYKNRSDKKLDSFYYTIRKL